ncbi:MAG: hypothetical protein INH41_16400 [Myxococcaceae bacterium]|jgi:hypothetical protein|nr:hypothetical protein [Myxococcaceae bacterium]MCA3013963.1 hypothetical protein [Myxococcaceae bacterium]
MRRQTLLVLCLFTLSGCAHSALRASRDVTYSVRDYLSTALRTLAEADTDLEGRRWRAELETRAALADLGEGPLGARPVPYDGPPRLEVALELLERGEAGLVEAREAGALEHTRRATAALRLALTLR